VLIKKEKGIFWGPTSMVPNFKDAGDMLKNFAWFVGLGEKPKIERYTYWEKFDYWAVFWGVTIIGSSGYAMWFAPFFARFLPGWALNAAQIIHSEEALLAVMFIFSIHFINAHLRPDCFPMDMAIFTGKITEEEFKTRHPQEFERLKAEGKLDEKLTTKPEKSLIVLSQVIGFLAIAVGLILLVLTVVAYFRE
jgi:cytochrome b subunit of formate dehydrogenase